MRTVMDLQREICDYGQMVGCNQGGAAPVERRPFEFQVRIKIDMVEVQKGHESRIRF